MSHLTALRLMDAFAMLAKHGTYTVIGSTAISRTYNGPEDLATNVPPLMAGFEQFPEITFQKPIVDGDRAFLLGQALGGRGPSGPYDQPHLGFFIRTDAESIVEIIEFVDTCMLETGVFGKKIIDARSTAANSNDQPH